MIAVSTQKNGADRENRTPLSTAWKAGDTPCVYPHVDLYPLSFIALKFYWLLLGYIFNLWSFE